MGQRFLYALLEEDKIQFWDPDHSKKRTVYTDATKTRFGWKSGRVRHTLKTCSLPIIVRETVAAFAELFTLTQKGASRIILFTDNMATAFFLERGTAGFQYC